MAVEVDKIALFTGASESSFALRRPKTLPMRSTVTLSPSLAARAWMRGRSDCGKANETLIGCVWLIVTSVAAPFAATMLPGCTRIGPVLPSIGARISVYSRFKRAISIAAWSASTTARALPVAAIAASNCSDEVRC